MAVILPQYCDSQVLVIGDVILDRYWYGSSHRISPEAPVPIVNIQQMEERPGGAANVAMNIAALGACVQLVGLTGVDDDARALNNALRVAKVDCQLIAHAAYTTLTKLRIMSRNQQLLRLDFEKTFLQTTMVPLLTHIRQCASSSPLPGAMVLSDYGKGTLCDIQPIIQLGRAAGIPILVDPKGIDFSRYRGATILTPNLTEFEAVVGHCQSEHILVNRGMQLLTDCQLTALLITRSEQGMTLLRRQQPPLHLPTQAREIYDVTGAGDTVIAVLAASLAAGTTLDTACLLANAAAGLVVGKLGTATVSLMELERSILSVEDPIFGVVSELTLKQAVAKARRRGECIVMTNGCFDILHAGHVTYLARARQLGDRLIVAVNSDSSVRHLKGSGRPINSLAHRMQILAALSSVDWVVPFSEETPEQLIAEILPDFLVKGGDYLPETIAGSQAVRKAGGKVQILDFVDECSTTALIQKILQSTR